MLKCFILQTSSLQDRIHYIHYGYRTVRKVRLCVHATTPSVASRPRALWCSGSSSSTSGSNWRVPPPRGGYYFSGVLPFSLPRYFLFLFAKRHLFPRGAAGESAVSWTRPPFVVVHVFLAAFAYSPLGTCSRPSGRVFPDVVVYTFVVSSRLHFVFVFLFLALYLFWCVRKCFSRARFWSPTVSVSHLSSFLLPRTASSRTSGAVGHVFPNRGRVHGEVHFSVFRPFPCLHPRGSLVIAHR